MKHLIIIVSLSLSLFSFENAVVVNKNSKIVRLSPKQIKDIFMLKKHFVNGMQVVPVNASASLSLRNEFEQRVLEIHREKLNRYWIKQHFQGISPPVVQSSHNSMKLFLKNVDVAIGYLPITLVDSDLRVVHEF